MAIRMILPALIVAIACMQPGSLLGQCAAKPEWFPHETARDIDFSEPNNNCEFHQWAWDAFLWLTQPTGPGRIRLLDLPTAEELFAPEEIGPKRLDSALRKELASRPLPLTPRVNKKSGITRFGAIEQAGSRGILVDQQGRAIYYASHVNEDFYDFVRANRLYDFDSYRRWPADRGFPVRSIELKSSWMIVEDDSDTTGFFSTTALINPLKCRDGSETCQGRDVVIDLDVTREVKVVLLGLHVVGVVEGHEEFIWSTFEHTNNAPDLHSLDPSSPLPVSDRDHTLYAANTPARDCNKSNRNAITLDVANQTLTPVTNVMRDFELGGGDPPNPQNIRALNRSVHDELRTHNPGSVWTNYRLVGGVWFPPNSLTPGLTGHAIQALTVGTTSVSNATMETFTQIRSGGGIAEKNCFSCHDTAAKFAGVEAKNLNLSHILTDGLEAREGFRRSRKFADAKERRQLNSFHDVQALFDRFVADEGVPIQIADHLAFWNRMTYEQFITGNILNYFEQPPRPILDPRTGDPLRVLIPGNAEASNLILALKGEGPLFNPDTGLIGRMPWPDGPPPGREFMPEDDIQLLANWINRDCPNDRSPPDKRASRRTGLFGDNARSEETAKVYAVDNIELAILPSKPPKALIKADGRVTSTGWSNPQLIPYVYVVPPADGIYEFDFVADRPSGISLPVLTPITAHYVYPDLTGVRGFRIYASSNSKEVKLSKQHLKAVDEASQRKADRRPAPDLPSEAKQMLADEQVRLHHHLWHFVRNEDAWNDLSPADRAQLTALGWQAPRFDQEPGSGLDFLHMHRLMIKMVDKKLAEIGDPYWDEVKGWDPIPWADDDPEWPVPEWTNPHPDAAWARHPDTVAEMRRLAGLLRDPQWLRQRSLDEVGIAIEWSIHGWMHLRWSGPPPSDISSTDVSNDWLFIPWSSHVNKHFWKLHGWIDERIEDWEKATGTTADFSSAWSGAPGVLPEGGHRADLKAIEFIPPVRRRFIPMRPDAQVIESLRRALKIPDKD